MFHNYFFLKRLSYQLDQILKGLELVACFSQNKDELILTFERDEAVFHLRANLEANISLISFPEHFARAGRNSVDLFEELIAHKVISVQVFEFERSFSIAFENNYSLVFKMHGRRSNILLAYEKKVIVLFRKKLTSDLEIDLNDLDKKITISEETFKAADENPLALIPALGKETKVFLEANRYDSFESEVKWKFFNQTLLSLESNPIYLHEAGKPRIDLLTISSNHTMDALVATNWLYDKLVRGFFIGKEKANATSSLKRKIKKSESYIEKTSTKLKQIQEARSPEEIANILMANLHQLTTGQSKAILTDLYSNKPISIKLNVHLSPQKNAEVYYRKSKNRHQEISKLQENIRAKRKLIELLSIQILNIEEKDSIKELRKYLKNIGVSGKEKEKEEHLPYHVFTLNDWTIMVGKNAKANDELTLKVGNKNDLWLHAKDVAGSHVIVREKPGQNYSTDVIEYAAALAAGNSKRKTDTLCPVMYTRKKYVRKVKGTAAGQVIVEKEEVVMVEPITQKQ